MNVENKDLLSSIINENEKDNNIEDEMEEKEIIFRNYIPQDRNFKIEKCYKLNEVKSIEDKIKANVLKSVKEFLNLEKSNNLIKPPKRDFDLKRNIPYNSQSESIDFKMGSFKFISNNLDDSQLECDEYIPDVFYIDTSSIFDLSRPNFTQEHILHLRDTLEEEPEWWKNIKNYVQKLKCLQIK